MTRYDRLENYKKCPRCKGYSTVLLIDRKGKKSWKEYESFKIGGLRHYYMCPKCNNASSKGEWLNDKSY
jgi:uncharacterized Zn-finger protein